MDILLQHLRKNGGAVVHRAGAGLLDAAGLVLDLFGADDLHVIAADLALGVDLLRAEQLDHAAILGDKRLARRAVDGIPPQQKTHTIRLLTTQ